jgi:hypothetical protein
VFVKIEAEFMITPQRPGFHRGIKKKFDIRIRKHHCTHIPSLCDHTFFFPISRCKFKRAFRTTGLAEIFEAIMEISSVLILSVTSSPLQNSRKTPSFEQS